MNPSRLAELGAIVGRILPDGREVYVVPLLYSSMLAIGQADDALGQDDHW